MKAVSHLSLRDQILHYIKGGIDQPYDDRLFNKLALQVFHYQFQHNEPYKKYCLRKGRTPDTVGRWLDIPAVPTDAFKELPMVCFPPEVAERVFITSGTTVQGKQGRHYMLTLELYNASLQPNFAAHLLPEGQPIPMLILAPSAAELPTSSLSHMLQEVRKAHGTPGSAYFFHNDALDYQGLEAALRKAEASGEPVCLLGTAFAFVYFLDYCTERRLSFRLPDGSRVMDTGGYKGKSREVSQEELYDLYNRVFGIPAHHVVNEYGMTEMATQFYDSVLRDAFVGVSRPRHKVVVPWARTVVVSPDTLEPLPRGETGILRHLDLANLTSVMALQTQDLGYETEGGFQVLGRAKGAEARGCSIAVDELLSAAKG